MNQYDKMIRLLDMAWMLRDQIVPCLVGPPGIGKTAAVMQHAKAHGCGKVVKIVASRCVPSETVGMTMPDHRHRGMTIYNSMQLSSLEDGDILFLDELLEADQFVLSTLLTVIESREMADGTPLPDIQIIAATNDTISPEQLRGNIRQRFMFQRFTTDKLQTRSYIRQVTGMTPSDSLLSMLTTAGTDYNFMTPRTLTKLFLWMDKATDEQQAVSLSIVINDMWSNTVGTELYSCWKDRERRMGSTLSMERQVRNKVLKLVQDGIVPECSIGTPEEFEDCGMEELLVMLRGLPNWDEIERELANQRFSDDC